MNKVVDYLKLVYDKCRCMLKLVYDKCRCMLKLIYDKCRCVLKMVYGKLVKFIRMIGYKIKILVNKYGYKKMIIFSSVVLGGGLLIIFIVVLFSNNFGINDSKFFENEYESLNDALTNDNKKYPKVNISSDNLIKYSSANDIVKLFDNKGHAVVYMGYPKCLYCRTAVQVLLDTASKTELREILYVDIENQGKEFSKLYEKLGDELVEDVDGVRKIKAPLVFFVVDGLIVGYNKGTLFSHESPYDLMDESQVDGLSTIYKYGIDNILETYRR